MLFAGQDTFPYVLFASGCDFHHTETIAKRIDMMNFGVPNNYVNITTETTEEQVQSNIDDIIERINIKKICGRSIASIFVKAHKWDEMNHGTSCWKKDEQVQRCKEDYQLCI
jgi:hypothetical protein